MKNSMISCFVALGLMSSRAAPRPDRLVLPKPHLDRGME